MTSISTTKIDELIEIAVQNDIYIPIGYFGGYQEITKEQFLDHFEQMVAGKKLPPISTSGDRSHGDINIFWCQEVAGYDPALRYQQNNIKGFVDEPVIRELRSLFESMNCRFYQWQFIDLFRDSLVKRLVEAGC